LNFLPYSSPTEFITDSSGKVVAVEFEKNLPKNNDPDNLKYETTGFNFQLKCDHLITSFGCQLSHEEWL
jgi:NADPH-dependent glutamate synthase beta subunit-like oxidoreductase